MSKKQAGKWKTLLILILFLVPSFLHSQVLLKNPGFPDVESLIYIQHKEDDTEIISIELEYINGNTKSWYEYHSISESQEVLVRLDADNLSTFYSEVWDRNDESTIHSINEIVENRRQVEEDELLITDMYGFMTSLRGFPWKERKSAKIVFLNSSGDFRLDMKVKGKETVHLDKQSYECWKVQIGMGGIIGTFIPKSYYWFAVESPHYLVQSESTGMPGSPKTILEIQSYKRN